MRETPVTISGLTIGRLVKRIIMRLNLLLKKCTPTAETVPITVATIEAIIAIISVFKTALQISWLWNSLLYHANVKPVQCDLLLDSLKENAIRTNIGRYINNKNNAI
ncbi:hypothetical protein FACS189481_5920 [Clostridia bacterium]|nr:hypothetical protein FACS189481_5920 [Clostridia bacterium]